ncbi:hypothetical protein ACKKBF_B12905 [Auxenochlorella protothecoides x Auxenochlorella symbiontica]
MSSSQLSDDVKTRLVFGADDSTKLSPEWMVEPKDAPRPNQVPWRAPGARMAAKPPADASPSLHFLGRGREHFPAGVRPAEPPRWGEEPGWRSDPKPRDGWVNREGGGDWRALDPRGGDEWRVDRWKHSPAPVPGDEDLSGARGRLHPQPRAVRPGGDTWRSGASPLPPPPLPGPGLVGPALGDLGAGGYGRRAGTGAEHRTPARPRARGFGPGGGTRGTMRMGPSCARHRYSTETLARLCRRLMYSGQLRLPRGLARDEPKFFLPPGDFVDVVEQLEGVDPEEVARLFEEFRGINAYSAARFAALGLEEARHDHGEPPQEPRATAHAEAHPAPAATAPAAPQAAEAAPPAAAPAPAAAATWEYQDPRGEIQGPFTVPEMLEWHEAGFFPMDLKLRPAGSGGAFQLLKDVLPRWQNPTPKPPGFAAPGDAAPAPGPGLDPGLALDAWHGWRGQAPPRPALAPPAPAQAPPPLPPPAPVQVPDLVERLLDAEPWLAPVQRWPSDGWPAPHAALWRDGSPAPAPPLGAPRAAQYPLAPPPPPAAAPADGAGPRARPAPEPLPARVEEPAVGPGRSAPARPASPPVNAWGGALPAYAAPQTLAEAKHAAAQAARAAALEMTLQPHMADTITAARVALRVAAAPAPRAAPDAEGEGEGEGADSLWDMPAPTPARGQPAAGPPAPAAEPRLAPWAAAAAAQTSLASAASLAQIQAEEAAAAAVRNELAARERAAAAAAAAAALPGGWAAAAARGAAPPAGPSMSDVLRQEERQRRAAPRAAPRQDPEPAPAAGLWAAAPAPHQGRDAAPGMFAVLAEEEERAADLEGGADPSAPHTAPPVAPPPRRPVPPPAARPSPAPAAAGAGADDDMMFWDYDDKPRRAPAAALQPVAPARVTPPPPPPAAPRPGGAWATVRARGAVVAPPPAANGAAVGKAPAVPQAQQRAVAPRPAGAAAAAAAHAQPAPAASKPVGNGTPAAAEATDDRPSSLSAPFRAWCREQLIAVGSTPDLALCEFLMTVDSNSEAAEYLTLYLGKTEAVSKFAAEFMNRRLEEKAGMMGRKARKARKQAAAANPARPAASLATAATVGPRTVAPPPAPPAAKASGATASGWEKVPKAPAGKKKGKKGTPVHSALLGFDTGTDYAMLANLDA